MQGQCGTDAVVEGLIPDRVNQYANDLNIYLNQANVLTEN